VKDSDREERRIAFGPYDDADLVAFSFDSSIQFDHTVEITSNICFNTLAADEIKIALSQ
jgi:hypothetical protein